MTRPKPIENPDTFALGALVTEYMDFIESEEYHEDNDFRQYIFEEAVRTIYGKDVWKYINSKI